jgi:hypothetical protein
MILWISRPFWGEELGVLGYLPENRLFLSERVFEPGFYEFPPDSSLHRLSRTSISKLVDIPGRYRDYCLFTGSTTTTY